MLRRLIHLTPLLLLPALHAQDADLCPPGGYLVALEVTDTKTIAAAYEKTKLGEMMRGDELAWLVEDIRKRYRAKVTETRALQDVLDEYDVETDLESQLGTLFDQLDDVQHVEHVRMWLYPPKKGSEEPGIVVSVRIGEEQREKFAKLYDEAVKTIRESDEAEAGPEIADAHGHEVVSFQEAGDASDPMAVWAVRAGDQILVGINATEQASGLRQDDPGLAAARSAVLAEGVGGAVVRWDVPATLALVARDKDADEVARRDEYLKVAGVMDIESVTYGMTAEGALVRETCFVEYGEAPAGWLKLLAQKAGEPAALAPPDPALMKIAGAIDIQGFVDLAEKTRALDAAEETDEPAAGQERRSLLDKLELTAADFTAAFTGAYSFSVSAPGLGSMIPRLCGAAALRDEAAFSALLDKVRTGLEGVDFEEREFEGVKWTSIKIPNNPSPMIPSFAVWDRTLYVADSPQTLKTLIRGREGETSAVEASAQAMPPALPHGLESGAMVMTYDTRAIFELIWERYLPMVQLAMGQFFAGDGVREPLIDLDDLPGSEAFTPFLGPGSGSIAVGRGGIWMSATSPLGTPFTAAISAVYAPMAVFGAGIGLDSELARIEREVCAARLDRIIDALRLHRTSFGAGKRFPGDLGALLGRGLIEDEAVFVVPSDEEPDTLEYENLDGEIVEAACSYKYLPGGKLKVKTEDLHGFDMEWSGSPFGGSYTIGGLDLVRPGDNPDAEERTVLLYEARKNAHEGRFVLFTDGAVAHLSESKFEKLIRQKL